MSVFSPFEKVQIKGLTYIVFIYAPWYPNVREEKRKVNVIIKKKVLLSLNIL